MSGLGVTARFQVEEISSRHSSDLSCTKSREQHTAPGRRTKIEGEGWRGTDPTRGPQSPEPGGLPVSPRGRAGAAGRQTQRLEAAPKLLQEPAASRRHGDPAGAPEAERWPEGGAHRPRHAHSTPTPSPAPVRRGGARGDTAFPPAPGAVLETSGALLLPTPHGLKLRTPRGKRATEFRPLALGTAAASSLPPAGSREVCAASCPVSLGRN